MLFRSCCSSLSEAFDFLPPLLVAEDFLLVPLLLLCLLLAGVDMMLAALLPALLVPLLPAVRNPNALSISRRDASVSSLAVRLRVVVAVTSSTPMGMVGWLRRAILICGFDSMASVRRNHPQIQATTSGHQAHGDIAISRQGHLLVSLERRAGPHELQGYQVRQLHSEASAVCSIAMAEWHP